VDNVCPDTLYGLNASRCPSLKEILKYLGHPGFARLNQFVKTKNLLFLVEDVRHVSENCRVYVEFEQVKHRCYKSEEAPLIRATKPWEQLCMNFHLRDPERKQGIFLY